MCNKKKSMHAPAMAGKQQQALTETVQATAFKLRTYPAKHQLRQKKTCKTKSQATSMTTHVSAKLKVGEAKQQQAGTCGVSRMETTTVDPYAFSHIN